MKKKCIYLLILIGLFFFMMSTFCYAEFSFSVDDTTYTYNTLVLDVRCPYCFIYNASSYYMLYCFSSEPIFTENGIFQTFEHYESYYLRKNNQYETFTSGNNAKFTGGPTKTFPFVWSNFDLRDNTGNIIFSDSSKKSAEIVNWDDIINSKFSHVLINTYSSSIKDRLSLVVNEYYPQDVGGDKPVYYKSKTKIFELNSSSSYLSELGHIDGTNATFSIPVSSLMILNSSYEYEFIIRCDGEDIFKKSFILGQVSIEDKEQQEKDKQLELQEEQNKTSKGIFDTLKELLDFINPFSEKFFVYKLIELLIEGLKGLFVPSDDFFSNWINDMNDWLSDRLGALYYPVDLVTDFLNRISDISESGSAVISGDGFEFMGAKVIPAFSYDLNSLLTNDTLKNIHDIYLTIVDVILYLCLIVLAKNTFVDIFGGQYDEGFEIIDEGVQGSVKTQNKIIKQRISLEDRRARNNYYEKRRRGQL